MTMTREQFYDSKYEPPVEPDNRPKDVYRPDGSVEMPDYTKLHREDIDMPLGHHDESLDEWAKDIYQTFLMERQWPKRISSKHAIAIRRAKGLYAKRQFATASLQKPVRIFERGSGIPLKERVYHRVLVLWRKRLRAAGKKETDAYRASTEKLIAQHARVNNLNTEVKYRVAGDKSHLEDKIDIDLSAVKKTYAGSAADAIK